MNNELSTLYGKSRLFAIYHYYHHLLSTGNNYLIEAYTLDFIEEYTNSLKEYTPYHIPPSQSIELLNQIEKLKTLPHLSEFENSLCTTSSLIKEKLEQFQSSLNGVEKREKKQLLLFPLIEKYNLTPIANCYGTIESVNILICKIKNQDRFLFVPSEKEIEERLLTQAQISYQLALNYFAYHKKKFNSHHEILIYFYNLTANYEGNSLGVALTIGFINSLSQLYNLPYITNIKSNVASTGSVEREGKINAVGKEVIEKKIETIFYSEVDTFIIPRQDEQFAKKKLSELNKFYPNRQLRLVSVDDITELLNRRDLVEIRKQNQLVRTAKRIKKNWLSSLLIMFLFLIFAFIYVRDFDDNPAYIEGEGNTMFVKNKSGKILWTKQIAYDQKEYHDQNMRAHHNYHLINDINNDGYNEIIVALENFSDSLSNKSGRIACFDKHNSLIWEYFFRDTVKTKYETLPSLYNSILVDIISDNNKKIILGIAHNVPNFSSAIFKLDAATGKRLEGTLWNPGHISGGVLKINSNGKNTIICNMYNNSYEQIGVFSVDYDKLEGTAPFKNDKYKILAQKPAQFNYYILTPNTDYNRYFKLRNARPSLTILDEKSINAITFTSFQTDDDLDGVNYEINNISYEANIVIGSSFRVRRDSLVAHGKLKPPYTDTSEYKALLKSQVLYWNGKEFVKRADLN